VVTWAVGAVVFLAIYAAIRRTRPASRRPFSEDLPWLLAILLLTGVVVLVGALSK
jgi:hypothetical protein